MGLVGLPRAWVSHSGMQVLRYRDGAFYGAHFDSRPLSGYAGCQSSFQTHGRPLDDDGSAIHCPRYVTVLYYLSNVSSGGETCFPIADESSLLRMSAGSMYNLGRQPDFAKKCIV